MSYFLLENFSFVYLIFNTLEDPRFELNQSANIYSFWSTKTAILYVLTQYNLLLTYSEKNPWKTTLKQGTWDQRYAVGSPGLEKSRALSWAEHSSARQARGGRRAWTGSRLEEAGLPLFPRSLATSCSRLRGWASLGLSLPALWAEFPALKVTCGSVQHCATNNRLSKRCVNS